MLDPSKLCLNIFQVKIFFVNFLTNTEDLCSPFEEALAQAKLERLDKRRVKLMLSLAKKAAKYPGPEHSMQLVPEPRTKYTASNKII